MRSRYSEKQKREIVEERNSQRTSVEELCAKYKISVTTYYNWKNELETVSEQYPEVELPELSPGELRRQNNYLRELYINLSEHNYQLAKFLKTT